MIKKWTFTLMCAFALILLAGCASNAAVAPSPSPSAAAMETPTTMATNVASASPAATNMAGVTTVEDVQRVSDQVEDELEKLTEIKEVEALVIGNMALVGVTFDNQYQEGLTTRLEDMIRDRIKTVHTGIENVVVTDKTDQIESIRKLRDSLNGGDFTTIMNDATTLLQTIKPATATATAAA